MSKIVVVGANHAGTACINTMLDNFGNENEIVVFDQNSNISFLGCGMALWIGKQIDGPEGLFSFLGILVVGAAGFSTISEMMVLLYWLPL